ncbi:FAD-binding oxidoreductase [Nocardia sp. NPDC052566]|uniref:FAD-binding oxidoreductase n=1 Tax=Nocardia sp. NPDC052566 TaxID=3364330 RepID=UPI0037C9C9E2
MSFDGLREAVRGQVLLAGDEGFAQASTPWNVTVAQPVAAVVTAADADDVAALIAYARRAGLSVAAQSTGHGASGDVDGVILLRTGLLNQVEVDVDRRVARMGAGAKAGQVQAAAAAHGLTALPGSSPVVGVAGYLLGGGLSWFSRKHGWASDAVRAFEIVDADGRQARVTAESDPELFWGLRGGGGDVAVVTAIECELFPAAGLYGGRVLWPGERTREVFAAFQELTASAPAELSVWLHRIQPPGGAPLVGLDAAYLGDPEAGKALLAVLDSLGGTIADTRGVVPLADFGGICAEPTDPTPALTRGALLTDLGDAVAELLIDGPIAPLVSLQIRHLGGALTEPVATPGARGPVAEPFLVNLLGIGLPHLADAVLARQRELLDALSGHTGPTPYTFLAAGDRAASAFDDPTVARLRALKQARDPHGTFRASFPLH